MAQDRTSSTHPPLPPTEEEGRLDWLRLLRSRRVGPVSFWRLLAAHGTARAALDALPAIAAAAGMEDYRPCPAAQAHHEMQAGTRAGARLVARGDPDYPPALAALADAPPLLWIKGQTAVLALPLIAVVGARSASSLGMRMARVLAEDLASEGYGLVSGLARGIDTAVHHATLESGTIAVLPGGIDVLTPAENAALAQAIGREGLLVSEQPPGLQPLARHFIGRNRLISGMAQGVVVVEAAVKSGSLITARNALDQGREVMAVPGHPFDARAGGCNLLLRDGAVLVRSARDVIAALTPDSLRYAESAPSRFGRHDQPLPPAPAATADAPTQRGQMLARKLAATVPAATVPQATAPNAVPFAAAAPHAAAPAPADASGGAPALVSGYCAVPAANEVYAHGRPVGADNPARFAVAPVPSEVRTGQGGTPAAQMSAPSPLSRGASPPPVVAPPPQARDQTQTQTAPPQNGMLQKVAQLHRQILARLDPAPLREDDLIALLQSQSRHVASALTELELDGQIRRMPGGVIARSH